MIQINITIELDAAELATLLPQWAALLPKALPPPAALPQTRPAKRPAAQPSAPTPQNGQDGHETPVLAPDPPAMGETPEFAAIPPATDDADSAPRAVNTRPRETLDFATFDTLVRREMKRLSMDGRMPGGKLWDSERDPRLPTIGAVLGRYSVRGQAELAALLGLEPPLSAKLKLWPTDPQRTPEVNHESAG